MGLNEGNVISDMGIGIGGMKLGIEQENIVPSQFCLKIPNKHALRDFCNPFLNILIYFNYSC